MSNKRLDNPTHGGFEEIRQQDGQGNEYWLARELQPLLDYGSWDKFQHVLAKAKAACVHSGRPVDLGSGAKRKLQDVRLSRYALAANLFRATQTEEKLRRDKVKGKQKANQTHFEVGRKVRQTMKELGGTLPEALPAPEKSIHQINASKPGRKRTLKKTV